MTNKQLQTLLQEYPDDMPIKLLLDHTTLEMVDLDDDNILHTSESAYCDDETPYNEWDTEDGKIMLGDGQQYLLFNPMIV